LAHSEIYNIDGIAIGGYDVVALHNHQVIKGSKGLGVDFEGSQWLFSSASNKELFAQAPQDFIPAFGGYCAYGASQGYKAKTQISTYSIIDGVLYLNFSSYIKDFWVQHPSLIKTALEQWPEIKDDKPISVSFWWIYIRYHFHRIFRIPYFPEVDES